MIAVILKRLDHYNFKGEHASARYVFRMQSPKSLLRPATP